jgi:hypothetical protein
MHIRYVFWHLIIGAAVCLSFASLGMATPVQWAVTDGGNGHWYEVVLAPDTDWATAAQATEDRPGVWYLATITSAAENTFVLGLFEDLADAWVYSGHSSLVGDVYTGPWINGMSSSFVGSDWTWSTGEPFVYAAWGPYEPFGNGDRITFAKLGVSIGWNDYRHYSFAPGYVVESVDHPVPVESKTWSAIKNLYR